MIGDNPSFSVSEFVAVFNQSLEMMYPQVSISGEISNFRVSKGKWVYFDLKDEYSSVKFFGTVFSLPGPLEDGITCEVRGKPRLHDKFGFSVNFDSIKPVGEGSLKKARDLLLRKLQSEGLFDEARKRSLPYPPRRISLVTSAESAAITDFRKIIAARWPRLRIRLSDTLVQGAAAPAAIVKVFQDLNISSDPPEVIVLIRGGGNADDLAAFNDELVVRAVASSRIPTLVAIGHEKDVSLAEMAADVRASTPSNAAELLVPDASHEQLVIKNTRKTLDDILRRVFQNEKDTLRVYVESLNRLLESLITSTNHDLANKKVFLAALDPLLPLRQGYALVRSETGKHIKRASGLTGSGLFSIEFTDGKKQARLSVPKE